MNRENFQYLVQVCSTPRGKQKMWNIWRPRGQGRKRICIKSAGTAFFFPCLCVYRHLIKRSFCFDGLRRISFVKFDLGHSLYINNLIEPSGVSSSARVYCSLISTEMLRTHFCEIRVLTSSSHGITRTAYFTGKPEGPWKTFKYVVNINIFWIGDNTARDSYL